MTAKSPEEYQAEIAALKAEIERLYSFRTTAMTGTLAVGTTASLTVLGVEEMILQVGSDDSVGYVNTPMARLLGMPDRKTPLGTPLSDWDKSPLGNQVLTALVEMARGTEEPYTLERACPGLPVNLLPSTVAPRPAGVPILRITATEVKGRVQIVAQDVTRLRWLEGVFSRYVSPAVIERMQAMTAVNFLSMERRELTILFGDLRGFTSLSQQLAPEEVQEVVNSFLAHAVECIEKLEGIVDKFVGDEVMALFGAPVPQEDHALRALVCAVEMQRVHGAWMKKREEEGRPVLSLGIGVATGEAVVGNVGTTSRMDYTALGHTVNLAARLCGASNGGEVLTVPSTHSAAMGSFKKYKGPVRIPRMSFKTKGKKNFKNVSEPVEVVSVSERRGT